MLHKRLAERERKPLIDYPMVLKRSGSNLGGEGYSIFYLELSGGAALIRKPGLGETAISTLSPRCILDQIPCKIPTPNSRLHSTYWVDKRTYPFMQLCRCQIKIRVSQASSSQSTASTYVLESKKQFPTQRKHPLPLPPILVYKVLSHYVG